MRILGNGLRAVCGIPGSVLAMKKGPEMTATEVRARQKAHGEKLQAKIDAIWAPWVEEFVKKLGDK